MTCQVAFKLESQPTRLTVKNEILMRLHVNLQHFFLLENLMTFAACVNFTVKVNERMQSQLFSHLEAHRTDVALEVFRVELLILVNVSLMVVPGGRVGEEPGAI